jgi:hypothetical protein
MPTNSATTAMLILSLQDCDRTLYPWEYVVDGKVYERLANREERRKKKKGKAK